MPLANTSVNLAGQPSKVGGTVARVFGWVILAAGWIVAAAFAGLILLLGGTWAALVVGGPIALIASVAAWALLRSGRDLKKSGDDAEAATKNQAIFALARRRNGVLTAWDVAQSLQVTPKAGDDVLTKLAKEHPDYVTVDVDDQGTVLYRFPTIVGDVLAPNAVPANVRVDAAPPVRVDARDALEDESEAAAEPARQKAR